MKYCLFMKILLPKQGLMWGMTYLQSNGIYVGIM